MQVINAVLAGALVVSSGPAMAAVSQADLSLWGGAPVRSPRSGGR